MSTDSTSVSMDIQKQETLNNVELKPEVQLKAKEFVQSLTAIKPQDLDSQLDANTRAKALGSPVESNLNKMSKLLQQPMSVLISDAESGGDVAVYSTRVRGCSS